MITKNSSMIKIGAKTVMRTKNSVSLLQKLHTYTSGIKALIAFLIALFLFAITHLLKFPGSVGYLNDTLNGQKTFDLSPSFSSSETYLRLQAFGDVGRTLYMRTMLMVDFIFPLSMFLFFYLFSKHASEKVKIRHGIAVALATLPVLYLLLDFIENIGIYILLSNYPNKLESIGSGIGILTAAKRIFMMAAIFVPLIFILATNIWRRFPGYCKSQRLHIRRQLLLL